MRKKETVIKMIRFLRSDPDTFYTIENLRTFALLTEPDFIRHGGLESISYARMTRKQSLEERIPELNSVSRIEFYWEGGVFRRWQANLVFLAYEEGYQVLSP